MQKNRMPEKIIELYKITRSSIEHFDKLLSDFRKIVFGFNGTVVAAVITFFGRAIVKSNSPYTDKTQVRLLFIGSTIFAFANILIWYLEKHYHRYLTISAKVSEEIEKHLFDNQKIRLTYQLKKVRNCDFCDESIPRIIRQLIFVITKFIRTYDCLYLFPITASVFLNIYLASSLKQSDLWIMSKAILLISIVASYTLIRHTYWVTEYYNCVADAMSDEEIKRQNDKIEAIKEMRNKRTWFFIGFARTIETIGFACIVSMLLPKFNNRFILCIPLSIGIFLFITGRGILLQKNWARQSLIWFAIGVALIVEWVMLIYRTHLILLSFYLLSLCGGILYYLNCYKTRMIFYGKKVEEKK